MNLLVDRPPAGAPPAAPQPQERTIDLALEGMTCAACSARIERVLNRMPGVTATVNLAAEKARVRYAPGAVTADALLAAVRKAGYGARPIVDESREQNRLRQRAAYRRELKLLYVSTALTLPFFVQMIAMVSGMPHMLMPGWLQWLLATPVQFWVGKRFYIGAWHALRGGGANMDVLIALGTTIAYLYSAVVVALGLTLDLYFEASTMIVTIILFGKILESKARARTTAAIEELIRLQPDTAHIERAGAVVDVPVAQVAVGDVFIVRPGDRVPIDGVVLEGSTHIDESMLTGESLPVTKRPGMRVFAATTNAHGMLRCRATGVGAATALAGIIRLVEDAQGSKAPIQRVADVVSGVFVPVVVVIAVLTLVATWWVTGDATAGLIHAVAVLVIAGPGALGLATPTAIRVASGAGARAGVLIRNAAALEHAARIDTLIVDKTGTLTLGKPGVTDVVALADFDDTQVLRIAASLEHGSGHPLARAIADRAAGAGVALEPIAQFASIAGKGVSATVHGALALVGSPRFAAEQGIEVDDVRVTSLEQHGKTVSVVALDGKAIGLVAIADRARPSSRAAVAALERMDIEVIMMTGDSRLTAETIAREVGIERFEAEMLPQDKARRVDELKRAGRTVGMVGDGVNDAPALAAADVSFAIAAGSDVAVNTADITLMRDDLMSVVDGIDLSHRTLRKIRQNLFFAFVYNVLGMPLAAIGMLSPVIAGAAMALSSVSVVSNSLLLRRWKPALSGTQPYKEKPWKASRSVSKA